MPKTSKLLVSRFYFVLYFYIWHSPSKTELKRLLPSRSLFATLFCYTFVTLQAIKLLSSIFSQFKLFVLNLNFVHCLELIDVFSANERSFNKALLKENSASVITNRVPSQVGQ